MTDKSCRSCLVDSEKCPFNQPPLIDGFEHLDSYKHHRIDCPHHVDYTRTERLIMALRIKIENIQSDIKAFNINLEKNIRKLKVQIKKLEKVIAIDRN